MGYEESLNIDESKRHFTQALFKIGAIKFGSFTLTSGKMSSYYIDLRIIPSHPQIFHAAVQMYASTLNQLGLDKFHMVAGIPTSGLVYASALAYRIQKPLIYIRKKAKDWGSGHRVEGVSFEGATVVMVDDVLTTGKSILEAAEAVRFEKGLAKYALVLVDREEGGSANLASEGIELHSPLRVGEMVDLLFQLGEIGTDEKDAVLRQIGGQR